MPLVDYAKFVEKHPDASSRLPAGAGTTNDGAWEYFAAEVRPGFQRIEAQTTESNRIDVRYEASRQTARPLGLKVVSHGILFFSLPIAAVFTSLLSRLARRALKREHVPGHASAIGSNKEMIMRFTPATMLLSAMLAFASPLVNAASKKAAPGILLEQLTLATYKEYAWIPLFSPDSDRSASLRSLQQESLPALRKVFTDDLAEAIYRDAECARISSGVCQIDFDILFDSQDPHASDLTVEAKKPDLVDVCFRNDTRTQQCIRMEGWNTKLGVRIHDVRYDESGRSLRRMLKLPSK